MFSDTAPAVAVRDVFAGARAWFAGLRREHRSAGVLAPSAR